MKTIGIVGLVASVVATVGAQTEENNIATHHIIPTVATQEEAFNLKHYIAHNVIGITEEEEQNMSIKEMLHRYNKVKKFIPPMEEEAFKLPPIHVTIGEEEAFNLKKFIKDKVIGVSEEEAAFNLKHYIAHNVIGITEEEALKLPKIGITIGEEQNMSLKEMAKRFNEVKKFIPPMEEEALKIPKIGITIGEEQNMSLKEMAKRFNEVKKFIPPMEEEAFKLTRGSLLKGDALEEEDLKLPKIGITIGEEEQNMSLKEMAKRFNEVKKFIPPMEEEAFNLKTFIKEKATNLKNKVVSLEKKIFKKSDDNKEEVNMSLKEMAKRYNKVKKFIPPMEEEALKIPKIGITIGEEEAFNLKKFIKDKVIGVSEEEAAFNLKHYIAHNVIGITEEEENMSLKEMAKRYNKVKKFIPPMEEEALKLPKIGITIGEEEQNMSLKEMAKRFNEVKKFIPPMEEAVHIEAPHNF